MTDWKKAAKGAPCYNCGKQDDTVILAHYSGWRQHAYGKGRGIKGDDSMAAPQCSECHAHGPFAEGYIFPSEVRKILEGDEQARYVNKVMVSEEQHHQIYLWHRDYERGRDASTR